MSNDNLKQTVSAVFLNDPSTPCAEKDKESQKDEKKKGSRKKRGSTANISSELATMEAAKRPNR